ncbi:glycoside hydrolase family 2 TIM barrel-domain containing protein [Arthrobacter sp. UYCu723]
MEEASWGQSRFEQSLNGVWKFHYARNFSHTLPGFEAVDVDCSTWDDIPVPSHIQMHGYDRPQYANTQYPWDGHEDIQPGEIPQGFNPVGSYVRLFTLDRAVDDGERVSICFKGAESAIAVWLNGSYIGYATDTFTPSEFDITDALVDGENKLAAQVIKWSGTSWVEDQDFYRFSGLFRDVVLHRRPAAHLNDLRVVTDLDDDFATATVRVTAETSVAATVTATLEGVGEFSDDGDGAMVITVKEPLLWSAEKPYLYQLLITVTAEDGTVSEIIPQRVGIRRFAIENTLLKINGKRVVFNGVNRHEFGLQGRAVSYDETEADVQMLKAAGFNAVRTSHYPNNSFFYDLCDEYGLYVMDEMNLESHAQWDAVTMGRATLEELVPGSRPEWRDTLLDRAANMLQRDKNHPSIVIWSVGNESLGGENLLEVANYFREHDSRPVHYEHVHWDPRYPDTTDIESNMYSTAADVEEFLRSARGKPFILCEYAHAMGNSFGAVDKYMDLTRREPLFQGAFIWDFADQAIRMRDRHGKEFFGYGGDNKEAPHDFEFSANGIYFTDHSPTPKLQEVKYLYQGLGIDVLRDRFEVTNRFLFTDSAEFDCVVALRSEGRELQRAAVVTSVAPGEQESYPLPFDLPEAAGEYTVDVSFRLRQETRWAPSGHVLAYDQGVFKNEAQTLPVARRGEKLTVIDGLHNVGVKGQHFSVLFSRLFGGLVSYRCGLTRDGGNELLSGIPKPNFWHAPTSNERGWGMPFRDGGWLLASRYAKVSADDNATIVSKDDESVEVRFTYLLPGTPEGECIVRYRVHGSGRVEVTLRVKPGEGMPDMPELGLLLTTDADFRHLRWYGEGPDECYVDRRSGARVDVYEAEVADMLPPYVRPQESGNRTGVRWATVTNDRGLGLRFEGCSEMEFSALPWTPFEMENALHPVDLPPIQRTVLRPALMRRGVGGDDSWGAMTHPEYRLPAGEELEFTFAFQGTFETHPERGGGSALLPPAGNVV